jgi:hypothetical protein
MPAAQTGQVSHLPDDSGNDKGSGEKPIDHVRKCCHLQIALFAVNVSSLAGSMNGA